MPLVADNDIKVYRSRKRMLIDNFLGGMMWSFGTLIGGILLLIIAGFVLKQIDFVPIVGSWLREVIQEALPANQSNTIRSSIHSPTPTPSPSPSNSPSPSPSSTTSPSPTANSTQSPVPTPTHTATPAPTQ